MLLREEIARLSDWLRAIRNVRADYRRVHKRAPSLLKPKRFTEKIQWRKIFDLDPAYTTLCDKLAVRHFIAARTGQDLCPPLLWSGDDPGDIPLGSTDPPFVLKSSHACGHVIMIDRLDDIDDAQIRQRAAGWLTERHGEMFEEPGYVNVPPRLLVERTVRAQDGSRPNEVRLFVFDGKVAVANTVFIEDGQIRNGAFHKPDWTRLDWHFNRVVDRDFAKPARFDDMRRTAETLGKGFDHVRVDFYDCGERFFVSEVTLYSWSGLSRFNPDEADVMLGAHWHLVRPFRRAVAAMVRGRRRLASKDTVLG